MRDSLTTLFRYWEQRRRVFASRDQLERFQEEQVRRLLRRVVPASDFTRERFGSLPWEEWQRIPVMDKPLLLQYFDRLNTGGISRDEAFALARLAERTRDFKPQLRGITVGLSSGTSGRQGIFLVSREERCRWAGTILAKMLPRGLLAGERVAFFLRAGGNLYETVRTRGLQFEFFDLMDEMERHLSRLKCLQPTILIGPPTLLVELSRLVSKGILTLPVVRVISVAEVLDPLDREVIESAFGQVLHQVYQATEGFLGATCSFGVLHLNEDLLIFEKEFIEAGEGPFIPIITDLFRTTLPIIRYRLDDILVPRRAPCPCGSVLLALDRVDGRCDDVFYWPALEGAGWRRIYPDFIRKAVVEADAEVRDFRVRQLSPGEVELSIEGAATAFLRVSEALLALARRNQAQPPVIRLANGFPTRNRDQKLRRIERCFTPEALSGPLA